MSEKGEFVDAVQEAKRLVLSDGKTRKIANPVIWDDEHGWYYDNRSIRILLEDEEPAEDEAICAVIKIEPSVAVRWYDLPEDQKAYERDFWTAMKKTRIRT